MKEPTKKEALVIRALFDIAKLKDDDVIYPSLPYVAEFIETAYHEEICTKTVSRAFDSIVFFGFAGIKRIGKHYHATKRWTWKWKIPLPSGIIVDGQWLEQYIKCPTDREIER